MKKTILIPHESDWFLGGNHFFNDLIDSFKNYSHEKLVFKVIHPDEINNCQYDGILSIRCHFLSSIDLKAINSPIFLYHDDFHYYKFRRVLPSKELERIIRRVDLYFTTYLNYFELKLFKSHNIKSYWVPWSVPSSSLENTSFYDWQRRENNVVISGMDSCIYPFRRKIFAYSRQGQDEIIKVLNHPSYANNSGLTGNAYYDFLRTSKGAFATTGKAPINFSVMKYFEIPASGCLPFFEDNPELRYLGFIDGVNCILIDEGNFKQKINIIKSPIAVEIAQNAFSLVKDHHTHNNRIEFISNMIANFLHL